MVDNRKYVLSIAGFDPSGGAGILADIKTFEANGVLGMGAVTALTFQNDTEFDGVKWIEADEIVKQISTLKRRFDFSVVKIGLVQNLETLETLVSNCQLSDANCLIIWDPIIKASAGFEFHKNFNHENLFSLLKNIFLITPNTEEVKFMSGIDDPIEAAMTLSKYCHVLMKGGHNKEEPGVDYLFTKDRIEKIEPIEETVFPKHGSGCVLSSAIAANLALGHGLIMSLRKAKKYVEQFLSSHPSLLGIHNV
jgi:hydroxymethylpyrimidine/phosphomethylpyrimidine kinase